MISQYFMVAHAEAGTWPHGPPKWHVSTFALIALHAPKECRTAFLHDCCRRSKRMFLFAQPSTRGATWRSLYCHGQSVKLGLVEIAISKRSDLNRVV